MFEIQRWFWFVAGPTKFQEDGLVFDYVFVDGGLSPSESAEAEEADDDSKDDV